MSNTITYKYNVTMTCEGCLAAVKRCLTRALGEKLRDVEGDMSAQTVSVVIVEGDDVPSYDQVFESVQKAGKECSKLPN